MKFLDKYKDAILEYYEVSEVGSKFDIKPRNLELEPTRMLMLLVFNEEGFTAGDCYRYFLFKKSRESAYHDLSVAKQFYESDRAFKKRYNEILKLVKNGVD